MGSLLGVCARLNSEVDGPPEINKVRIALVLDLKRLLLLVFFVFLALFVFVFVLIVAPLTQNLGLQPLVFLLVRFPVRVVLEDI